MLLCVGVHDLGTSAGNDFQVSEKVVEWCVDNQFEHVELWDRVFASPGVCVCVCVCAPVLSVCSVFTVALSLTCMTPKPV